VIENTKVIEYMTASIRAVAASFPIIGSLAAGWSEYKNIKQAEHIDEILIEFAKKITQIEESLDKEFLRSDEMKNLIEQAVNKGKDEIAQEKRRYYSEFLKNSATKELSLDNEKEMILETISKLSVAQIKLMEEATEIINSGKSNITKENEETWPYFQLHTDYLTTGDTVSDENIAIAIVDYMLAVGVLEMPIHRGRLISYETRSITLSNLGWRVINYLK